MREMEDLPIDISIIQNIFPEHPLIAKWAKSVNLRPDRLRKEEFLSRKDTHYALWLQLRLTALTLAGRILLDPFIAHRDKFGVVINDNVSHSLDFEEYVATNESVRYIGMFAFFNTYMTGNECKAIRSEQIELRFASERLHRHYGCDIEIVSKGRVLFGLNITGRKGSDNPLLMLMRNSFVPVISINIPQEKIKLRNHEFILEEISIPVLIAEGLHDWIMAANNDMNSNIIWEQIRKQSFLHQFRHFLLPATQLHALHRDNIQNCLREVEEWVQRIDTTNIRDITTTITVWHLRDVLKRNNIENITIEETPLRIKKDVDIIVRSSNRPLFAIRIFNMQRFELGGNHPLVANIDNHIIPVIIIPILKENIGFAQGQRRLKKTTRPLESILESITTRWIPEFSKVETIGIYTRVRKTLFTIILPFLELSFPGESTLALKHYYDIIMAWEAKRNKKS